MANDFKIDLKESEIITEFLDNYFYKRLKADGKIKDYFRNSTDISLQYQGVDIVIENNKRRFLVDEKAQAHYRKPLPTFAFETSYLNRAGKTKTGWLIDERKETEFWILIWPTIDTNDKNFTENDINHLEVMLIRCKALLKYLEDNGWPKERIEKFDYCFRNTAPEQHKGEPTHVVWQNFDSNTSTDREKFYWYYSSQLKEKPINIVVRKEILKKIASSVYYVDCNDYRKK